MRIAKKEQFEIMSNLDIFEILYWGLQKKEEIEIVISSLNSLFLLLNHAKENSIMNNDLNIVAEKIMKNGILKQIEKLQYDDNEEIYQRSYILIDTFFATIEEEL